jgi:hypothetical protein
LRYGCGGAIEELFYFFIVCCSSFLFGSVTGILYLLLSGEVVLRSLKASSGDFVSACYSSSSNAPLALNMTERSGSFLIMSFASFMTLSEEEISFLSSTKCFGSSITLKKLSVR